MGKGGIRPGLISATASPTRSLTGLGTPCCVPAMTSPRRTSWWCALEQSRQDNLCDYRLHNGFWASRLLGRCHFVPVLSGTLRHRPGRARRALAIWDELGYVVVKLCDCWVERSEPGCMS